jgi:2-keto-4-pentenoate hydratase/2-oxohepta-3-ene-1,7-dioic acid hydratase in catechol pathway
MEDNMIKLPLKGTDRTITINPSKIIAVGLNYREHIKESVSIGDKPQNVPKEPVLFAKTPNVLIGPGEPIVIPALIEEYRFDEPRIDPECELAVIIGKRGRHIRAGDAFGYILGYTCFNDVSMRNIQTTDPSGWFRGKSFDTFGPIGPVVVPAGALDPQKLALCSRINGVPKQRGNTQDMIFSVPFLVAFISKQFTLEEGDIIATGTPSGISPVHPGDSVDVEVEGIGVLTNPVIEEGGASNK